MKSPVIVEVVSGCTEIRPELEFTSKPPKLVGATKEPVLPPLTLVRLGSKVNLRLQSVPTVNVPPLSTVWRLPLENTHSFNRNPLPGRRVTDPTAE